MELGAISRVSTSDVLAGQLREAIVTGVYKPGDRLVEAELAERFDISRGPVREAMRTIAGEGLVQIRKNRGAVVSTPTPDDVLEVYALRMGLGEIALQHAAYANLLTGPTLRRLTQLLERMDNPAIQNDRHRMVDADLAFQAALIAAGELPRITDIFAQTDTDIRFYVQVLGIEYDDANHTNLMIRHRLLVDTIIDGDATSAAAQWRSHIQTTVNEFVPAFDARNEKPFERPLMRQLF